MTDQSADLVTKIDVVPDLAGLTAFEAEIDRAKRKVEQLGAAIRHVNNLAPKGRFAPSGGMGGGAGGTSSAATVAAVSAISASGANLVSRLPVGKVVAQEAAKIRQAVSAGASSGIAGLLPPPGRFGGFLPPSGVGSIVSPAGGSGGALATLKDSFFPDTSAGSFSGTPLDPKNKTPVAQGVNRATGGGLGVDNMLGGAALTAGIVAAWNSVSSSLDNITKQENQLARLPQTIGSASDAFLRLNKAASDTKTDAGAFISTYANIATTTEKMGLSEKEATEATQGLTSALALGGGSEQAVTNALFQMGQAFSSNRFAGDEFRSFMEAIGTMAPEVAKAFDTDVAGLREMSEQGKLTAEIVVKAFRKMSQNNLELLKKQGWTWGQVTTVMTNDWNAFLAKATIGGEWQRFTDWAANTLIPIARAAENEIADFWSHLADESKTAMLMGILAALGAAFAALAIPVLAATWPFLAVGAAVWLLYELFVEFKAWMNGEGATIFDRLFDSFDQFEKRYPSIVNGLRLLSKLAGKAGGDIAPEGSAPSQQKIDEFLKNRNGGDGTPQKGLMERFLEYNGNFNPLPGLEKFLGLFVGDANAAGMNAMAGRGAAGMSATYNNSGNKVVNIYTQSPSATSEIVNGLDNPGTINDSVNGNIAIGQGAI